MVDSLGRLRDLFAVRLLRRVLPLFLGIFGFAHIALNGLFGTVGNRTVIGSHRLGGIRRGYGDLFFFLCAILLGRVYRHLAHFGALGRERCIHRLGRLKPLPDQHHQHRAEGEATGDSQPLIYFGIHIFHKSILLFVKV